MARGGGTWGIIGPAPTGPYGDEDLENPPPGAENMLWSPYLGWYDPTAPDYWKNKQPGTGQGAWDGPTKYPEITNPAFTDIDYREYPDEYDRLVTDWYDNNKIQQPDSVADGSYRDSWQDQSWKDNWTGYLDSRTALVGTPGTGNQMPSTPTTTNQNPLGNDGLGAPRYWGWHQVGPGDAFKPHGSVLGHYSQILRYGGIPASTGIDG